MMSIHQFWYLQFQIPLLSSQELQLGGNASSQLLLQAVQVIMLLPVQLFVYYECVPGVGSIPGPGSGPRFFATKLPPTPMTFLYHKPHCLTILTLILFAVDTVIFNASIPAEKPVKICK